MKGLERIFDLFADYFQFLVEDSGADWEDLADRWTDDAVKQMFIQGDGYVAIGTARNVNVPVTVRTSTTEPALDPKQWDKIVQGGLKIRSGQLQVTGVTDNGLTGGTIPLEPGDYNVRALYRGLETLSENGLRGDDEYVIEVWPVARGAAAPTVPQFVKP